MPFIDSVADCCVANPESIICGAICGAVVRSDVASPFFPDCAYIAPRTE